MAGYAVLTIKDKQWEIGIVSTPWELSQGLGGIAEIPISSGMLFDTGFEQIIQVTTESMFFALDIAFLSSDLGVTEIYRNVGPSLFVTSQLSARYFLEVNAGEMGGIEAGDTALAELLPMQSEPVMADWMMPMAAFVGVALISAVVLDLARGFTVEILNESAEAPECEIVRPRHYDLVSWFNSPAPD